MSSSIEVPPPRPSGDIENDLGTHASPGALQGASLVAQPQPTSAPAPPLKAEGDNDVTRPERATSATVQTLPTPHHPPVGEFAPRSAAQTASATSVAPQPQQAAKEEIPEVAEDAQLAQEWEANAEAGQWPAEWAQDDEGTVDEDGGVIRCICGIDDDDGFTIQCDRCLVWQHCACFGMSQASVPDEYLCEQCDPRAVDTPFAQALQQKRKDAEARKAAGGRSSSRRQSDTTDKDQRDHDQGFRQGAASTEVVGTDGAPGPEECQSPGLDATTGGATSTISNQARTRKHSESYGPSAQSRDSQGLNSSSGSGLGNAKTGAKRKQSVGKSSVSRKTPAAESPSASGTPTFAGRAGGGLASHSAAELDELSNIADRLEAWHVEYTPIGKNLLVEPRALQLLASAMADYENGSPLVAQPAGGNRVIAPVAPKGSRGGPSQPQHARSRAPSHPLQPQAGHDGEDGAEAGEGDSPLAAADRSEGEGQDSHETTTSSVTLAAVGQECVPVEIETFALADVAQRTYVKQISELASAGVFNNVNAIVPTPSEPSRAPGASRTFSKPVMHGLFADVAIPAGCFIAEYRGELLSADSYRAEPINQYAFIGASKPHVHVFPPPLSLALDAQRFGTEARFARFSCHPNAVIRPILLRRPADSKTEPSAKLSRGRSISVRSSPPASSNAARGTSSADVGEPELLFGLFAIADIPRTHEVTLGWEWDDAHIVHLLPELVRNPTLGFTPNSEPTIKSSLESRQTSREKRSAALAALAEKGEFPYANASFSAKTNEVLTVLLGCTLCACIGSAAAPGGHGATARTNNARKQDCAIAQMLRLAQGMGLMNVVMPGNRSHRKVRLPDFSPLVGIQRGWRRLPSLPPTPSASDDAGDDCDALPMGAGRIPRRLAPGGVVERILEKDLLDVLAFQGHHARNDAETTLEEESEGQEDACDSDTVASSLTEPLSALYHSDEGDGDDGEDDLGAELGAALGLRPPLDQEEGTDVLPFKKRISGTRLKAQFSGGEEEDPERSSRSNRRDNARQLKRKEKQEGAAASAAAGSSLGKREQEARGRGRAKPGRDRSSSRRRVKRDADAPYEDDLAMASSARLRRVEEDSEEERVKISTKSKSRRRRQSMLDPSSPLTSAPSAPSSPELTEASLTPVPDDRHERPRRGTASGRAAVETRRGSRASNRGRRPSTAGNMDIDDGESLSDETEEGDGSDAETSSSSEDDGEGNAGSTQGERRSSYAKSSRAVSSTPATEDQIRRRNADALATAKAKRARERKRKLSLAGLNDSDLSEDDAVGQGAAATRTSKAVRELRMERDRKALRRTQASTKDPRAGKKAKLVISSDESENEEVEGERMEGRVANRAATSPSQEQIWPAAPDGPSRGELEHDRTPSYDAQSAWQASPRRVEIGAGTPTENSVPFPFGDTPLTSPTKTDLGAPGKPDHESVGIESKMDPSMPPPPAKPEPPRAKLSLAEYKKRLAERRTSGKGRPGQSEGPGSTETPAHASGAEDPSARTPASEAAAPLLEMPPLPPPPLPSATQQDGATTGFGYSWTTSPALLPSPTSRTALAHSGPLAPLPPRSTSPPRGPLPPAGSASQTMAPAQLPPAPPDSIAPSTPRPPAPPPAPPAPLGSATGRDVPDNRAQAGTRVPGTTPVGVPPPPIGVAAANVPMSPVATSPTKGIGGANFTPMRAQTMNVATPAGRGVGTVPPSTNPPGAPAWGPGARPTPSPATSTGFNPPRGPKALMQQQTNLGGAPAGTTAAAGMRPHVGAGAGGSPLSSAASPPHGEAGTASGVGLGTSVSAPTAPPGRPHSRSISNVSNASSMSPPAQARLVDSPDRHNLPGAASSAPQPPMPSAAVLPPVAGRAKKSSISSGSADGRSLDDFSGVPTGPASMRAEAAAAGRDVPSAPPVRIWGQSSTSGGPAEANPSSAAVDGGRPVPPGYGTTLAGGYRAGGVGGGGAAAGLPGGGPGPGPGPGGAPPPVPGAPVGRAFAPRPGGGWGARVRIRGRGRGGPPPRGRF